MHKTPLGSNSSLSLLIVPCLVGTTECLMPRLCFINPLSALQSAWNDTARLVVKVTREVPECSYVLEQGHVHFRVHFTFNTTSVVSNVEQEEIAHLLVVYLKGIRCWCLWNKHRMFALLLPPDCGYSVYSVGWLYLELPLSHRPKKNEISTEKIYLFEKILWLLCSGSR